ncbi:hypothetical protein DDB_G0293380 [Dictyostelium discoideum AX4]|uniref:Putative uncharacterized protein DDB_G0293380 n=1 Tax=Dictyostelium discoideum TaxID=44689 RepID=Y3380_DICDI|nr:hypothetical protein DDB_G0293380 [Dictyostelium discoideum AX4]Q54BW1.1 RecName: Full=Putative uncharacterized protein DDB_G0293380 [Dictyostelium discoideum]EAL60757.1 hypothetical protein DDB_G0293380 [Dictyostelium discoideum AX4]|eukprot:XP_629173.1 hypothetical protein DDB_G0293380 [Dictyostelium discoideum AX4]
MKLFITITPNLEKLLHNEIKDILRTNKLTLPKFQVFEGGIEIDLTKDPNISEQEKEYYLWSISNCSRLAESIRIRVGLSFPCKNFSQFNINLEKLDYKTYFPTSSIEPQVAVSCNASTLYHTNAIKERFIKHFNNSIKDKISIDINYSKFKPIKKLLKNLRYKLRKIQNPNDDEIIGGGDDHEIIGDDEELSEEEILNRIDKLQIELEQVIGKQKNIPQSKVFIRIDQNVGQLSVDACTSGEGQLLHKRTLNKHISDAPIRETLASAIIMAIISSTRRVGSGTTEGSYLDLNKTNIWDPFVGSGTLIQEAISMLLKAKPSSCTNYKRSFQFERFKNHSTERYLKYLESINKPISPLIKNTILIGSDIDQKAIDSSIFNLSKQGYQHENIKFFKGDFKSIYLDQINIDNSLDDDGDNNNNKPFTIITNLPYGTRVLNRNQPQQQQNQPIQPKATKIKEGENYYEDDDDDDFFSIRSPKKDNVNIYLNNSISKDLRDLFKRFGDMIHESNESVLRDVFVLNGNSHFQSISTNNGKNNFEWERILNFRNGGLTVELLKMVKKPN